jgi:transporter family-2 protein
METVLTILAGLLGGAAVGIQSPIAGAMGQRVGGTSSSVIVHASGLLFSIVLLLLRGGERMRDWRTLPFYMLGAGIFGLILYQTINITFPRLGGTIMVALIIIGQLTAGMVIDHFGWLGVARHPIDLSRVVGMLMLFAGGFLISK